MKNNTPLREIAQVLRSHQSFVLMSHLRPDGDALGCVIALALCLKGLGKQVKVWNEDGMLDKYRYLPSSDLVTRPPAEPEEFDVAIALDTGVENRLGTCQKAVKQAKIWINIVHHISNARYGDLVHVDPTAPATGQILFELFQSDNLPVTPEMADNLFVAISTDTGSFQYPNTTARTYEIGAELLKAGVNVGKLSQLMYESHPRRRILLLRELLNTMHFSANNQVASFALSMDTIQRLGSESEDTEGLIDTLRGIEGVIVAAFLEELPEGKVRISLRSKDPKVDVCKICALFGGGGHTLAAGARTRGSLPEVQEKVLTAISNEIGN